MTRPSPKYKQASLCLPSDPEILHILEVRANNLAQEIVPEKKSEDISTYVCFTLGNEDRYGIPIQYVQAIISNPELAKPPATLGLILGVINWRGSLITILDLKQFFKGANNVFQEPATLKQNKTDSSRKLTLIVSAANITLGFMIHGIYDSDHYELSELEKPLIADDAVDPKFLTGLHHGTIAIIHIENVVKALAEQLKT